MVFRFRYRVLGDHTHVQLFAGRTVGSLGNCGALVFRNEEWEAFMALTHGKPGVQFIAEGDPVPEIAQWEGEGGR